MHTCQPFAGYGANYDPDFPRAYQVNPWCWAPNAGFHRAKNPDVRLHPTVKMRGTRLVGPLFLGNGQAFRLGAGLGTTNVGGDSPIREMLYRMDEIVDHDYRGWINWTGSAEAMATLGYKCRHLVDSGAQERLSESGELRREWFRRSVAFFTPDPRLGVWSERIARVLGGEVASDDEMKLWDQISNDAYRTFRASRESMLDYAAPLAIHDMVSDSPHHGGMRSICRLLALTEPSPERIVAWWDHCVAEASRLAA